MSVAVVAIPPKPKIPATIAITKNMMLHVSIGFISLRKIIKAIEFRQYRAPDENPMRKNAYRNDTTPDILLATGGLK